MFYISCTKLQLAQFIVFRHYAKGTFKISIEMTLVIESASQRRLDAAIALRQQLFCFVRFH